MAVVTPQQFREQTGDTTHFWSEIAVWLSDATQRVGEALRRQLESDARTERMKAEPVRSSLYCSWSAAFYPSAYPVTAVADSRYVIEYSGRRIRGGVAYWDMLVEPYASSETWVDVTYTGGYDETTLPATLRRAIIDLAQAVGVPSARVDASVASKSQGDSSISYFNTSGTTLDDLEIHVPGLSSRIDGYRNRF